MIVNIDENRRETAEELAEFVPHVVVTHPQAPADNLELYRLLGAIFSREAEAERLCARVRAARSTELRTAEHVPLDVLYLIWRDPWMAVAPDTYIARRWSWSTGAATRCRRPSATRRSTSAPTPAGSTACC